MRKSGSILLIGGATALLLRSGFSLIQARVSGDGAVSFSDYWPVLGAIPAVVFGVFQMSLRDAGKDRDVDIPAPLGSWYEMKSRYDLQRRTQIAVTAAALWNLLSIPTCIDFFRHAGGDYRPLGAAICVLHLMAGFALILTAMRFRKIEGRFTSLHLEVSRIPLLLGQKIHVRIELEFGRKAFPAMFRIGLLCLRTAKEYGPLNIPLRLVAKPYSEQWRDVMLNQRVTPKQRLTLEKTFDVPADAPPSSPADKEKEPWFIWQARVQMVFNDGPTFKSEFPLVAGNVGTQSRKPDKPKNAGQGQLAESRG
jgi:hypothetical protein